VKTIALFNNKGGVGKTSLVYHLAWMYADLGLAVIAADLDPQANLSSMFLDEDRVEALWSDGNHAQMVYGAVQPLLEGTGDVATPHVERVAENLGLLVGDLTLSASEDELSSQWPACLDRQPRAFRVLSAFWRVIEQAARAQNAALVLIDMGPNLGAINRGAMISAEHVVIPLAPDLLLAAGPEKPRSHAAALAGGLERAARPEPRVRAFGPRRSHAARRLRRDAACRSSGPPSEGVCQVDGANPR